jgi:hypothetical protein
MKSDNSNLMIAMILGIFMIFGMMLGRESQQHVEESDTSTTTSSTSSSSSSSADTGSSGGPAQKLREMFDNKVRSRLVER